MNFVMAGFTGGRMSFKIRSVEERDFIHLRKLIRDTRFEHFPEGFKQTIFFSFKIQVILFLVANVIPPALNLHKLWALIFYPFLISLSYGLNYFEWKKTIREISLELDSWNVFSDMYLKPKGCLFIVATTKINKEEVIAGCVGLRLPSEQLDTYIKRSNLSINCFEVMRTGVDERFRRQGLAKLLMKECEDYVQNHFDFGKFDFVLECTEVQYVALDMYRKLGYNIVGVEHEPFLCGIGVLKVYVLAKKFLG